MRQPSLPSIKALALIVMTAMTLLLSACGIRGPLTLPDHDRPATEPAKTKLH